MQLNFHIPLSFGTEKTKDATQTQILRKLRAASGSAQEWAGLIGSNSEFPKMQRQLQRRRERLRSWKRLQNIQMSREL
jgi:hypothetical protein